jgi:hypothetical protein
MTEQTPAPRQRPIRIWADTAIELEAMAASRGLTVSRIANVALAEWVAKEKAKAKPHLGNTSAFTPPTQENTHGSQQRTDGSPH